MDKVNILIIVSTAIFLIILWAIVAVRHLKHLKLSILDEWELVDESLRKRHDLIPNLIETVRMYSQQKEELLEKLIAQRQIAAMAFGSTLPKIEAEHTLSDSVDEVLEVGKEIAELGKDTNFLELKTEIDDLEQAIEIKVKNYNQMVRYYNSHRRIFLLVPMATIFGFGNINIFEFES